MRGVATRKSSGFATDSEMLLSGGRYLRNFTVSIKE